MYILFQLCMNDQCRACMVLPLPLGPEVFFLVFAKSRGDFTIWWLPNTRLRKNNCSLQINSWNVVLTKFARESEILFMCKATPRTIQSNWFVTFPDVAKHESTRSTKREVHSVHVQKKGWRSKSRVLKSKVFVYCPAGTVLDRRFSLEFKSFCSNMHLSFLS